MNIQVNIGNDTPEGFATWLEAATRSGRCPRITCTILPTIGTWEGETEPGVAIQVWDTTPDAVDVVLYAYGHDHPAENYFGVMDLPASRVMENPYRVAVATPAVA